MNYLVNTKGNRQLILDGYLFNKQKTSATNVVTWDCVERRKLHNCNVRVKSLDDEIVARLNMPHDHPPQPERLQAAIVRSNMKQRAKTSAMKTRDIISNEAQYEDDAVLAYLPTEQILKRDIQRNRKRAQIIDPVPAPTDIAFILPQRYCVTNTGRQF